MVSVEVIVPPGVSSHSYEPTFNQLFTIKKGDIWFRIGESFEKQLLSVIKKDGIVVDQRDGIDLLPLTCSHHSLDREAYDPHIWLSPPLLKIAAKQIAKTLSHYHPERASFYQKNLNALLTELDSLDKEISNTLSSKKERVILVSHPAFGYFCHNYGIEQLSIEMEGQEATPIDITDLLRQARALNIGYVFLQKQHNTKGGKWIAHALGAKTIFLDPYAEDVIENLKTIAQMFSEK